MNFPALEILAHTDGIIHLYLFMVKNFGERSRIKNAFNGIFYRKRRRFVRLKASVQAMLENVTNQVTEALLLKQSKNRYEETP